MHADNAPKGKRVQYGDPHRRLHSDVFSRVCVCVCVCVCVQAHGWPVRGSAQCRYEST
jgi:hypothetical protein